MNDRIAAPRYLGLAGALALALAIGITGCKTQPAARTDQQIATDAQAKIQGEEALANQNIQVAVNNGVATLSGSVSDEASRALAGNDSGTVAGVKTVVNNLVVQPPQAAASPATQAEPPSPAPASRPAKEKHDRKDHRAVDQQSTPPPPPQIAQETTPTPAPTPAPAAAP